MINIEQTTDKMLNEFMFNGFAHLKYINEDKDVMIFEVDEKYGVGTINIYELTKGLYLCLHKYSQTRTFSYTGSTEYSEIILNVQHYIKGNIKINLKGDMAACVKTGDSLYYCGSGDIEDTQYDDNELIALSLFSYTDNLLILNEQFKYDENKISSYIEMLKNRKDVLISKTDSRTTLILKDILSFIESDNTALIRLRGIELYLTAIENYSLYESRKEQKYQKELIERIIYIKDFLEQNWSRNYTINELSETFNISQTYIKNIFKYVYDIGPAGYIRRYRLYKAKELIETTDMLMIDIANTIGYSNSGKFARAFQEEFGILPIYYKKEANKKN